jgi:hypothetical protein
VVTLEQIAAFEANLNISHYIEPELDRNRFSNLSRHGCNYESIR